MSINQWVISWLHDTLWLTDALFAKESKWNVMYDVWLWRRESWGRSGLSGGVNTRSHIGFCPDPEAFTDTGRAQRFIHNPVYQPYCSSNPRLCSVVLAPGVGWKMCFRRTEEIRSLWRALCLVRADLNSNSQTNTLSVSHLSLAYGSYKVIRQFGTHHHCGQTCSADGERTRH